MKIFLAYASSDKAVADLVVAQSGPELKAMIVDQNLEGAMQGSELAAFARQMLPHLNIVMMSGQQRPRMPSSTRFLQKPFSTVEFVNAIRTAR